jgi:Sulfotransferase domain
MRGVPERTGGRRLVALEVLDLHSRLDRTVRLRWRGLLPPLPTFLLIGAPQCGTTWLHVQLLKHPDVAVPRKEIRYFTGRLYRSLRWYGDYYRGLEATPARGDMSPNYYRLTPDGIRLVRDLMPDARLLFIARDPVDRAWSAYRRARPEGEVATVAHVGGFLKRSRDRRLPGLDGGSENGRYAASLANWLQRFPREQLLVLPFDRIALDPAGMLSDVLVHIGVDPARFPWSALSQSKVNANPPARMPDDVRGFLSRHFDGEREALASLLRCDPLWPESEQLGQTNPVDLSR